MKQIITKGLIELKKHMEQIYLAALFRATQPFSPASYLSHQQTDCTPLLDSLDSLFEK